MIVLAAIVRDESSSIAATIASALPFVDSWCIADTGSVDGTLGAVMQAVGSKPGQLLLVPFQDFSQARNAVLDAIEPGSWVLWLDADDKLVDGETLRAALEYADTIPVTCLELAHRWSTGQVFTRPTLVKAGTWWRFQYPVHEILRHPSDSPRLLRGPSIFQERTQLSDMQTFARQAWDVTQLEACLAANPGDPRAKKYLALTQKSLNAAHHEVPTLTQSSSI